MAIKVKNLLTKFGKYVAVGAMALAFVVGGALPAFAQDPTPELTVETGVEIVTDAVTDVGSMLVQTLPTIFGFLALLIGIFFIWRQITKRVGRAK